MGKIFCLMGKSSTGKDTIGKYLLNTTDLINIVLYTTRPIREGEINGREYYFVDEAEFQELENNGKVIEKRVYDTIHGNWTYATVNSNIDLENNNYLTLNTLEGYEKIVQYYGRDVVVPIYIWVDLNTRIDRAFLREEKEANPKYREICRRFIADEQDFCPENLLRLEIFEENIFENNDLDICLQQIKEKILVETKQEQKTRKIGGIQ